MRRRSVPGVQESLEPDAIVRTCARCSGREPNVRTCQTCGATGKVTILPRASRMSRGLTRVRLDLTIPEATSLVERTAGPEVLAKLADAIERARDRSR